MLAPTAATLKKYGLSEAEWIELLRSQGGVCPVCKIPMVRPVVDHEHVRNWKKLKPETRKKYVRGLCCWRCNYAFLGKGMTLERACNLADYLLAYRESFTLASPT